MDDGEEREVPVFVVIEGLDGSGKSTLAEELARRLGAEHLTTPMATLPPTARRAAEAMCADDPLARMLFYASTVVAASKCVGALLATGRSVVMDRYWLSTVTYHRILGSPTRLDEVAAALLPADLTVFLDVSTEVRRARLHGRGALQAHDRMTLQPGVGERIGALYREMGAEMKVAGRFEAIEADELSVAALVERVAALARQRRG